MKELGWALHFWWWKLHATLWIPGRCLYIHGGKVLFIQCRDRSRVHGLRQMPASLLRVFGVCPLPWQEQIPWGKSFLVQSRLFSVKPVTNLYRKHIMQNLSVRSISNEGKKKWRGTSTWCFPWQSLHSMLEVTVTGVRLRKLDSWQAVWTLQTFIALLTSSVLLFYPWMSISLSALPWYMWCSNSVLSHLSSQIWTGCTTIHLQNRNCPFSLLSLYSVSRERREGVFNDHETFSYVDR